MPRHGLPGDRPIEHPADLDAVEIGRGDTETEDPPDVDVHHHQNPVTLEQD